MTDALKTVTIVIPSGYRDATEFLKDCGFDEAAPSPAVLDPDDEETSLLERLRNPQWVHGNAPFESPQLDKEQTVGDMAEAAWMIDALCNALEVERSQKSALDPVTVEALAAHMARLLYNDATLDDCTDDQKAAWISPIVTVADLVNNLLTIDQTMDVYGAYFIDQTEDRCRARGLSISREHVINNRIKRDESIPYSLVIWSAVDQRPDPVSQTDQTGSDK
jgi:hypothetical protein